MGLVEKRAVKAYQEGTYTKLINEINKIAGFKLVFEIDWDKLAEPDYGHLYEEAFTKVYFTPIINAFKEVTIDELGRNSLKKMLKKIVIKNENDIYYAENAFKFEDGVLTIDHKPLTNIDNIQERSEALFKAISDKM
ncbi:MAG: hypothetical protein JSU07_10360 [Bacteroidetes bacterium]|nr:hypothetical protein [Bacteroidota bacterium]